MIIRDLSSTFLDPVSTRKRRQASEAEAEEATRVTVPDLDLGARYRLAVRPVDRSMYDQRVALRRDGEDAEKGTDLLTSAAHRPLRQPKRFSL